MVLVDIQNTAKTGLKNEIWALFLLLALGLLVRSLHFAAHLDFSAEQGSFSLKSWSLWQSRSLELVGPPISFRIDNRLLFQGSVTYYFQLLFLLLGKWDPVFSSFIFTVFGVLMGIPLYFGSRMLASGKTAFLVTGLYYFWPLFIDYSRFFWNPNFQLTLLPLLILLMGLYHRTKKPLFMVLLGLAFGFLLLFHYQLIIVGLILLVFLLAREKTGWPVLLYFLGGAVLGFSPMLVFEFRHHFYNTQTALFYLKDISRILPQGGSQISTSHYYLSISLILFVLISVLLDRRLKYFLIGLILLLLFVFDLGRYARRPDHGFGMVKNWHYQDELQVYRLIRGQNLSSYNIVNLSYDTLAQVQRYLHRKDGVVLSDDYRHNRYLYVVDSSPDYLKNPAYEVNTFKPSHLIKQWNINDNYQLYLLQRDLN